MKFQVEVLSTETIKPSSPTPDHLRHHNLAYLDQIQPPIFMPMVLFYPKEPDHNDEDLISIHEQRCSKIKKALSDTLVKFYPLAGRVHGTQYVDCNDEGAYYVEAKTDCKISDIIENPNPKDFNKFLPLELDAAHELPVCFQVTFFACGGMSIAMGMSHKIGDGLSYFTFLNGLAAESRGEGDHIRAPEFVSDKYFPHKDLSGFYQHRSGIIKQNISTKRFVFDAPSVQAIRAKCVDMSRRPTRVEALSAFIWCRYIAACTNIQKDDVRSTDATYTVSHAVNLRTRMEPPLPEYTFGNVTRTAIAVPPVPVDPKDGSLHGVVNHVREAIKQVNTEYIKKLQEGDEHLNFLRSRSEEVKRGEVVSFSFTSLCRFPIYDADFGWGKPVYVGSASLTFKNLVSFFDTNVGDGVEAWINLKEEDMEKFEADEELLKYVSPAPSTKNAKASIKY